MLIPSIAFRYHPETMESTAIAQSSDDWVVHIQGWLFRENSFRAYLGKKLLSTFASKVHKDRVAYFTASGQSYKSLCLNDFKNETCIETNGDGVVQEKFQISNEVIKRLYINENSAKKIKYAMSTPERSVQANGEVYLCDDSGISIISDIDDTIKVTGVTHARSVIRNTFSGDYEAVTGMSERYRHYELSYNASFHYLTACPDQLYPFLRIFFERERFPLGSFHMRHFTWFDSNFVKFFSSSSFIEQKTTVLYMFLEQTRSRKFILFGDVFQKDPEIYANIYKLHPQRIIKIFIRISKDSTSHRLNDVFKHMPKDKWATFVNGFDLPEVIF